MATTTKYVSVSKTKLFGSKPIELLWGDSVQVLEAKRPRSRVKARGVEGEVETEHLGDDSLLEVYFIDVGQGDGILIRTPDGRHVLIDGGQRRALQVTRKNAADFVDWKFRKDYGRDTITLDAVVASHNDADHFGGLLDLLSAAASSRKQLDCTKVTVDAVYHAGVSWWAEGKGRTLGAETTKDERSYLVDLLGDRASAERAVKGGKLAGPWGDFVASVVATRGSNGRPTSIQRLAAQPAAGGCYLPGFGPEGGASIKVLAPVEHRVEGKAALPVFDRARAGSKTTNGNSVVLRLDYGSTRMLLTGDLNAESQRALMEAYEGHRSEFACDVAKGCHHGSEDVSFEFLQSMQPAVTVISSGDAESYDHPRPSIVAASALAGFRCLEDDRVVSPLVYSTEIARSYRLIGLDQTRIVDAAGTELLAGKPLKSAVVEVPGKSGKLQKIPAAETRVVNGLVYGLVNVRSDGRKILCATLNEANQTWCIKEVRSRF